MSESRAARDRVTLADIAAAAGVSVPTVSKVLNGHADVAPKTRSRVEALLADYNYAAPRRAGRSCLIDLVFADLSPWAVEIIRGAEEAASAEGCRIAISVVSGEPDTEQWLTRLSTSQTDGVILVLTELSPAYRARLAAMHMPVVIVTRLPARPADPSIGSTNWRRPDGHRASDRDRPPPDRDDYRPPVAAVQPGAADGTGPRWSRASRRTRPWSTPATSTSRRPWWRRPACWNSATRRQRSSRAATCRRWGSTRRPGGTGCVSPMTSAWSASTTCPFRLGVAAADHDHPAACPDGGHGHPHDTRAARRALRHLEQPGRADHVAGRPGQHRAAAEEARRPAIRGRRAGGRRAASRRPGRAGPAAAAAEYGRGDCPGPAGLSALQREVPSRQHDLIGFFPCMEVPHGHQAT